MVALEGPVADLPTGGTGPGVTQVLHPLLVMTVRLQLANLLTLWRFGRLLLAAGNLEAGGAAVADDLCLLGAGVAGPLVTPGHTLVVLAVQGAATHLLAGRAVLPATALLVAGVPPAVTDPLALEVACELLGAPDLLLLGAAPTRLGD